MIVPYTAAVSLKINFARLQGGSSEPPRTPGLLAMGLNFGLMNIVVLSYRMSQRSGAISIILYHFEMALLYYVNAGGEHTQAIHMHYYSY